MTLPISCLSSQPILGRDEILDVYGPQLGELAWHSLHVDSRISAMSEQHASSILRAVEACGVMPRARPIRILEVGAYAHYGAHRAAAMLGGVSFSHDVSPTSLRIGLQGAREAGIGHPGIGNAETGSAVTLVAGDFHDLPFENGYFDVVFCASSVHHTFRPWRVLGEMLRVLRPGGVLQLENEPIGRDFSFYGFRGNRAAEHTPFEAELDRRGSTFLFSSPFPGSRPEVLFGMIENERMPLDMVLGSLEEGASLQALTLVPQISVLDRQVLALPRDRELEARLAGLIMAEIAAVRPIMSERDRLLGASLPPPDEVWRLSYRIAPRLRGLDALEGDAAAREQARLFGAALQATVVKDGGEDGSDERATTPFRRQVAARQGVMDDLPVLPGLQLDFGAQSIPAIEDGDHAHLAEIFATDTWESHREAHGLLSMLNLRDRNVIALPSLQTRSVLLLRFYAVATAEPYKVLLRLVDDRLSDESVMSSVVVAQSESMLFREVLPAGCGGVAIETRSLDGRLIALPRHVRIGILRLVPIVGG